MVEHFVSTKILFKNSQIYYFLNWTKRGTSLKQTVKQTTKLKNNRRNTTKLWLNGLEIQLSLLHIFC